MGAANFEYSVASVLIHPGIDAVADDVIELIQRRHVGERAANEFDVFQTQIRDRLVRHLDLALGRIDAGVMTVRILKGQRDQVAATGAAQF